MADNKYGRLFTEEDLREVVAEAMNRKIDGDDGLDQILIDKDAAGAFQFPKDFPLFLIRW